jgi:hypothetical protein
MSWMYRLILRANDETSLTLDSSVKHLYWGSTGTPNPINTADDKGVALYFSSTATSGTTYGEYIRLDQKGASGEFIAGRRKTLLTVASAGNAHGGHDTLELDTSAGNVTGLGTGLRGNVVIADRVVAAGTYYGVMAELYGLGGTAALPAGSNACLACSVTGGGMEDVANVFSFACTSGTGHAVYSKGSSITGTMTGWIRVLVNGAVQYMPLYAAAPS